MRSFLTDYPLRFVFVNVVHFVLVRFRRLEVQLAVPGRFETVGKGMVLFLQHVLDLEMIFGNLLL